jgi:cytoskeletal protein CcmA (bactofilin family)
VFSRPKDERDFKSAVTTGAEVKSNGMTSVKANSESASKLGPGMVITGNIVCDGPLQIHGHVLGDIHTTQLSICAGAHVEGKVVAQETVIDGLFRGTIHSNSVKLHGNAVVEGEIYNKSLNIEENAQFEGVSRRLDKPVEAPPIADLKGDQARMPQAPLAPASANGFSQ